MCGVVGYIGKREATPILLNGLRRLEYRGYDSSGVAVFNTNINLVKTKGKIINLDEKIKSLGGIKGNLGIAHTRWATHGAPSDANSHPHSSNNNNISIVHNGIIENYFTLKTLLIDNGYTFKSETDTEVVANLLDYYYTGNILDTLIKVMGEITGSYAFGIICSENPDEILAVRKHSPLVVGIGKDENFIASDIPAILEYTKNYYLLDDEEIAVIKKDSITIYDKNKTEIKKDTFKVDWDISVAEKGGYDYFMLKEIMEQPKALTNCLSTRIINNNIKLDDIKLTAEEINNINKIHIVACGSAWHAGLVGKSVIEELTRIPVEVDLASEFRYRNPILTKRDLCLIISQSGETADTLAALREAKRQGVRTLSIVNVVGSSIARESDDVLYTWAGPEIAVATTKGYSTQVSLLYLIALKFGYDKNLISKERLNTLVENLKNLPNQINNILKQENKIKSLAKKYSKCNDVFLIGRGIDYPAVMEASLKLKEISYVHSEAYAAGELKHGTISLIEEGTFVIAVATQTNIIEKTLSNLKEVRARGAKSLVITSEGTHELDDATGEYIFIPKTDNLFAASLVAIPLQLFAYYVAIERGCDVDMPRNLAKSVTVE